MSYSDQMEKYRQSLESQRPYVGDPSGNGIIPLPTDQSENIYSDKVKLYQNQIEQNATGPLAGIGGAYLLKQGVQQIPAVKNIVNLYNASQDFRDSAGKLFSSDGVQQLLKDPVSALNNVSEATKANFLAKFGEATDQLKTAAIEKLGELKLPDISNITSRLPSAEQATQMLGRLPQNAEEANQLLFDAGKSVTAGARSGAIGDVENTVSDIGTRLQGIGSHLYSSLIGGSGEPATPEDVNTSQEQIRASNPVDEEEEFSDAIQPPEATSGVEGGGASSSLGGGGASSSLGGGGDGSVLARSIAARTARQATTQGLKSDIMSKIGDINTQTEADTIAKIQDENITSNGIKASVETDLTANPESLVPEVFGSSLPEEGVLSGIADFLPGIGTVGAIASIAGIIGEAIVGDNEKNKLAKDEAQEQQREDAIQQNITNQQSQIVGQGRQEVAQQAVQSQILSQQRQQTAVPVSQVGTDRT